MTLYDSSVLIEYLAGESEAVNYVESHADERAVAPPLVLYEVYQGEVFKSGPTRLDALDDALQWLDVVDGTSTVARSAAELQGELQRRGAVLSARDAFIAGAAAAFDERLVTADVDFAVEGLPELLDVTVL